MKKSKEGYVRAAGILMPVSSLPSPYGIGSLGSAAYEFIDFLATAGQHYWQVLPIGMTSYGDSPYQSFSAFAGNPYFIDLDILCDEGLLERAEISQINWGEDAEKVDYSLLYENRYKVLRLAYSRSRHAETGEYRGFCDANADWLPDFCLYMALKNHFDGKPWGEWDEDIRTCQPVAVARYEKLLCDDTGFYSFLQYKFFEQWRKLKKYAKSRNIEIIGDIPIYVSMDSSDVWASPELFQMDESKRPTSVAGVPPDYFSKKGQLWGNPLYDWSAMKKDNFAWWRRRIDFSSQIYDVIRIDHFIGIVSYYAIDAGADNAVNGEWRDGPGEKLIAAIDKARGRTRMIAEDLGEITEQVRKVQKKSGYPGMKVLQFAFDGNADNHFLPHNHRRNFIVYTGTHDNDTTAGAIRAMSLSSMRFAKKYLGVKRSSELPEAIIRAALASVAHTAIIPMYDWLGIGSEARLNTPSTVGRNWRWRMKADALTPQLLRRIAYLTKIYGRSSD